MDLATVDTLLTTTRSVRKRLDMTRPVEPEVIERCLEIAMQAPTGGNRQGWSFVVVTEADKKARIAEFYRKAFKVAYGSKKSDTGEPPAAPTGQMKNVLDSASYLAEHLHEVPLFILPCIEGRAETRSLADQAGLYGSILPAAWSLMLALRSRGLGSAWTTLHLYFEKETSELLGIPPSVTQACLLPVAYFTGTDFKPADRQAPKERTFWNQWGSTRGTE